MAKRDLQDVWGLLGDLFREPRKEPALVGVDVGEALA